MSSFRAGDRVEIVGPAENGSTAFVGQTSPVSRVWNNGLGADVDGWGYPASSLRLVPVFKAGDRVKVLASTNCPSKYTRALIGQVCTVTRVDLTWPVLIDVQEPDGETSWIFNPSDLELVAPALPFKVGDRVRLPGKLVSYPGETETTITCIWHAEGKPDLYELADGSYRRFEELQHAPAPARVPKVGEVWGFRAHSGFTQTPVYIVNKALVTLSDHTRIPSDAKTLEWIATSPAWTFLADSPEAYFKARS